MKAAAYSQFFSQRLAGIRENTALDQRGKIAAIRELLLRFLEAATAEDRLQFSTTYARVAYLAHREHFPSKLVYQLHRFRLLRLAQLDANQLDDTLLTAYKLLLDLNLLVFKQPLPAVWEDIHHRPYPFLYQEPHIVSFQPSLRVVALEWIEEGRILLVREEEQPEQSWRIHQLDNELINNALQIIQKVSGLPVLLNLLQVEVLQDRSLVPKQIVVEPDYLIDVTAVAACFDGSNSQAWGSLSRKLLPYEQRPALLKGNIVNLFLDVLVNDPSTEFKTLVKLIFPTQPLALCCLSDAEVKQLVEELKSHYIVLRQFVNQGLKDIGVEREDCQLEPSFYSPTAGIQGRLDLLYRGHSDESGEKTSIVELKSGKLWMPNKHGLNRSHFVQTLLYHMMISAAFGRSANVAAYVLYSQLPDNPLRYAPPERFTQAEAIAARNQLLAIELLIGRIGHLDGSSIQEQTDRLLAKLQPDRHQQLSRFTQLDFERILQHYEQLSSLERTYFGAFLGFIAREHRLAKTGRQGVEQLNGLASLWLDEASEKAERFEILSGLRLADYDPQEGILSFHRPKEAPLAKFRTGDIVVLYATQQAEAQRWEVTQSQVFKSTIIDFSPDMLRLRLRARQLNDRNFRQYAHWCVEKDVLDSSFSNHYQGLWAWVESEALQRQRWLGLAPPTQADPINLPPKEKMTAEQRAILARLLAAPNYFLLWGPPGTGKTSFMLHYILDYLLAHTRENILLVAYTNRAVDEICESIERLQDGSFRNYLRIGSRYGTAPAYQAQLLNVQSEAFSSRAELLELIGSKRIVVGTVASVGGKEELFRLKSFDRILVDEASQIVEPLLLGLLARVPKAVLIGDHRQLPAVVQQSEIDAWVRDPLLLEIGLKNMGSSLFERLFIRAQQQGWHWAYDRLRHQGRMHEDIMAFPASAFYDGELLILPENISQRSQQIAPLQCQPSDDPLEQALARQRLLFLPTPTDQQSTDKKTNRHEAQRLLNVIRALEAIYAPTPSPIQSGDIGIITPYRAQIATIRETIATDGTYAADDFTIDTVERYQGGARRIILLSLCTNEIDQMKTLAQTSAENIDRKLNVAMTRAREHLVLLGCRHILETVPHYADLLAFIDSLEKK